MKKKTRRAFDYRIKMWFYRSTKEDVYKMIWFVLDNINLLLACAALLACCFILPALLH
jgi:hypothetical protein